MNTIYKPEELYHYGVPGMKWGKRKAVPTSSGNQLARKKAAYKLARKEYNKSFNKAYDRSIAAWSPIKKHREANDARWQDTANKADKLNAAKSAYKQEKKTVKAERKAEKAAAKALKKMEKQKYKDTIKEYRKQINAAESFMGKVYNKITDADKYQAELMYAERHPKKKK